jgi:predicted nucleic acid-binding protein
VKIVVDTNILFSGILNPNGSISDILLNSQEHFEFYAPTFVLEELENHHKKLMKISGLTESDIVFLKRQLFKHIELIDLENIHQSNWQESMELVKDIDEFDAPFIALSIELEAPLWTGDKKLVKGLSEKGVYRALTLSDMVLIRDGKR